MQSIPQFQAPSQFDVEKIVKLQLGAMSPMWMAFAGYATVGAAVWSASRWMSVASTAPKAPASRPDPVVPIIAQEIESSVVVASDAPAAPLIGKKAEPAVKAAAKPARAKASRRPKAAAATKTAKIDGRTKAARDAKAARLSSVESKAPAAKSRTKKAG